MTTPYVPLCDLNGVCTPAPAENADPATATAAPQSEVLYVGDPMCSWCWGISPGLEDVRAWARARNIPFTIVVGGLRPGGGDAWTPQFRSFLRHHWEEIGARSGQPFTMKLLDRPSFNYDTEPAARAVLVARSLLKARGDEEKLYDFFADIQRKFYAEGEDPKDVGFYESLCADHGLDFSAFRRQFETQAARSATAAEFARARALGVRAFPTVLFRDGERVQQVAAGYATGEAMVAELQRTSARRHA